MESASEGNCIMACDELRRRHRSDAEPMMTHCPLSRQSHWNIVNSAVPRDRWHHWSVSPSSFWFCLSRTHESGSQSSRGVPRWRLCSGTRMKFYRHNSRFHLFSSSDNEGISIIAQRMRSMQWLKRKVGSSAAFIDAH